MAYAQIRRRNFNLVADMNIDYIELYGGTDSQRSVHTGKTRFKQGLADLTSNSQWTIDSFGLATTVATPT